MTTSVPIPSTANIRVRAGGLREVLTEAGLEPEVVDSVIGSLVEASATEATPPAEGSGIRGFFVNRGSGVVQRVTKVDNSYAHMEKIDGTGHWAMPLAEYDANFVKIYRPATVEDLSAMTEADAEYRPPANAPEGW